MMWLDKTYIWHVLFAEQLLFWAFCVCLTLDIYLQLVKKCDAKINSLTLGCFIKKVTKEEVKKEVKKYTVKPPKDLRSKFEAKVEAKKKAEEDGKEKKRREEENARIAVSL